MGANRGDKFEQFVRKELNKRGLTVVNTSNVPGFVDIVAVHKHRAILVECKSRKVSYANPFSKFAKHADVMKYWKRTSPKQYEKWHKHVYVFYEEYTDKWKKYQVFTPKGKSWDRVWLKTLDLGGE